MPGGTGDLFTEGQPNPPAPPAPGPPGGAGPNLPPAAQVPDLPNYRNAASFITAQVGDPAIERDVQIILAGRMNRDRNPIEAENAIAAHPEVDRIQAMMSLVERARGKGSAWDPQLAQENLRRYVSGDPTLPANALGSQVRMDVVDKRPGVIIRLGPNAQQPTRSVTGTVTEVSRVQGQRGMVYVRLRAVDGSDHFERVPADMRLDVQQPVDQNGPLAGAVRDVRSSLINVVGISAADRMYYAAQVQGLSGGNIPADDAHARVDDIRNSVINTTDGGERTGVMNALDRLDMAIDEHAAVAPGPEPVAPQGETVRARELSVGDQISYDTPEGTVSGEIEGMHTAAANTVVTLRHPDDTRSTRAFGPDATVQRLQAADPPTQYVAARDLRAGERIIVPDATGAYRPATILAQRRDLGGTGLTMEIVRDNGDHETLAVDPSEALPRVTAGDVAPEPDLPPITPDPQPEDGTKFARDLQPGDRIASYGDTITVVRSRVSPDGQTVTARIRLANGTEDDATFGSDAVLPLVDPPNTVDVAALPADAASARPVLYTYQRKNIVALNLDDPNHPASSPVVAQAAARIRNRQALTEEQSAALADALRAQASAPGVRAPRQRSLQRQAYALDAAAASAAGRQPPAMPNRDRVEKTRPGNLVEGDWVAVRGQGAGGGIDVLQVLGKRPMMGGRLHELTVRDQDGNESRRLVAGNADTYLLPDLPRDLPAPPPAPEQPRLEHVVADRIAVGDTIRIPVTDQNYNTEMRDARVTDIRREPRGEGLGFNTRFATDQPGPDGGPYWFAVGVASGPTTLRVSRGPGSQEQPYDSLLPAENPEPIRNIRDLQVGDRITIPSRFGAPTTGVIHEVDPGKDERGKDAVILSIREDNGQMTGSFLSQGDTVTRLSKGDAGAAERLLAEKVERERQQQVALIADRLTHVRATMIMSMSRRARLRAGRFQPTELSQAIIQARVPDRGADEATPLAQRLSGGDSTLATALAPRLQEIIAQMRQEESDRMLQSLREVRPDPGQADSAAAIRVLEQWEASPPSRDMTAIATTLHQALAAVRGDEGTSVDTTLNIPEGADLRTRIAAYREAIGGSGEGFGKKHVTRTLFKPTTLDDLEAGRVPETEQVSAYIADRAPDDGPGEVAMAHHDVIVAAGRELDAELQRRIAARDSGLGSDPEATITTLADEKAAAYQAFRDAVSVRIEAHSAAERAALEGTGFTDRFTLHRAQRQAHWDGGPGAAAEEERLKALEEQVNRDIASGTREAQAAEDAAHERSRQVDERYYTMVKRLARIRREVAMEILAEHRQTGGVRMDWINPSKRTVLTERSELVKAMRGAEDVYPTDWLQRFKDRTGGRYNLKSVKRGHFKEGIEVALSTKAVKMEGGSNKDDVAVHELGHAMEWVVPGLVAAEAALLWARTSEGPVGSRTRQKQSAIYKGEYGYKDDFPEHYTGKDYGGKFYEVFTTSVESVFAGSSYTDENLRHWLLGTMALI